MHSLLSAQRINNNYYHLLVFIDIIKSLILRNILGLVSMKNALLCTLLFCSVAQAHEPYVAPLAYHTENTQVPVLSAYAEQAFHPEYALKDISFSVFQPNQTQTMIQAQKHLESATAFDLKLPEKGTYS